jgi:hypothetical protein
VNRAFAAVQESFKGLFDSAVMIDFTLEEDEFTPTFYGVEALVNALADLLPEAEARAIHQLLSDTAGQQLGNLYRDAGRRYILPFAIMAATLAAVPLPFATMPVLTALQGSLVGLLGTTVRANIVAIAGRRSRQRDRRWFFGTGDRARTNQIYPWLRQRDCSIVGSRLYLGTG